MSVLHNTRSGLNSDYGMRYTTSYQGYNEEGEKGDYSLVPHTDIICPLSKNS